MIRNVLITGGAGNLGRVTAEALREDYGVTLFDRMTPAQAGTPWETDLPFVLGDLTDLGDCMRAVAHAKADAIIHWGALPWPTELTPAWGRGQRLPEDETMRVNTMGTYYVMDAARRLGVKQVVLASTFFVLGIGNIINGKPFMPEYLPIDEEHPNWPQSTYGLSKVLDEEILAAFTRAYGIATVAFRLMGVHYPHLQNHTFARTPQPEDLGPTRSFQCFEYVDCRDVALACKLVLQKGLPGFEAFYLATDTHLVEDTAAVIERLWPELKDMAKNLKGKEGAITIAKARHMLGYEPQYSWRNGCE